MRYVSYEIDHGGDTELVLKELNSLDIIPKINSQQGSKDSSDDEFDNPSLGGRYTIFDNFDVADKGGSDESSESDARSYAEAIPDEVRVRVSSRHLILASHTFLAMLNAAVDLEGASIQA